MQSAGVDREHHWAKVLPPVLVCALLWGSAFPAIKTVYGIWARQGVVVGAQDFWWFAGVRFTIAGVALLIASRRPWAELRATPKFRLFGFALSQTFFQYLFFYLAMSVASGSLAGLLTSTGSFWWMILTPVLLKVSWPTRRQWAALIVGGLGITLATAAPGAGAGDPLLGAMLMLAATGFGALGLIQFRRLRQTISARAATGWSLLGGGGMLLLVGSPAFARADLLLSLPVVGLTLWLALVSAAAFSLWNHLSTRHPVPLLAGYRFLVPLCGMLESLLFLKAETAGWGLLVGAGLVVVSLVMAQRAEG